MKTYIINLARSSDRRDHMVRQLAKTRVRYEFVRATDWRETDLDDTRLFDSEWLAREQARGMRPGHAAAALSHLEVCRRILADGGEYAMVLEDDITLPADLAELAGAVHPHMATAEVVLLFFSSLRPDFTSGPCTVMRTGSIQLPSSRSLLQIADGCLPMGGGCYLITREACQRRVDAGLPIRAYPDDWSAFYRDGVIDRLRCVTPMQVRLSPDFRTTIDQYEPGSVQGRIRELVARTRTPILHQALALRRLRTFRRLGWAGLAEFVDDVPGTPLPSVYCRSPQWADELS